MRQPDIKALVWDIGGTVFDWYSTVKEGVEELARLRRVETNAYQLAVDWRNGMFQALDQVRKGQLPWMNADQMHRLVLDDIVPKYSELGLREEDKDNLNQVWHRIKVWPDFDDTVEKLRIRYTNVVLTILSFSIAVDASKLNGISWDGILSCEFLGHYKPDAEAYIKGVRLLGLKPGEAMMVAAHKDDLFPAKAAGLHTAFVPRLGEKGPGNDPDLSPEKAFDINAKDFQDLVAQLMG